jgi:hypothetical protein
MRETDLLADLVQDLAQGVREEIAGLDAAVLGWRSDPGGNPLGVTVWHIVRWLDRLSVQLLADRPMGEEYWFTGGWAARTGYDPQGLGRAGSGTLTGYTPDEVAAVPILAADDLLVYLDVVCAALRAQLPALSDAALAALPAAGGGRATTYQWTKGIITAGFAHLGEIRALKALHARTVAG